MAYSEDSDHKAFVQKCVITLDSQVFELESEKAKIMAIQAVQRVLRGYLNEFGEEFVLEILRYPEGRKDFHEI